MSTNTWKIGDPVIVADLSQAHGDKGMISAIKQNGLIIVELDAGCVWPVTPDEIRRDEG